MSEQDTGGDGLAELEALPGGARAALEAVLMVIDQPATAEELAAGLNVTVAVVEDLLEGLRQEYSGYTVKAPAGTLMTCTLMHVPALHPGVLSCGTLPAGGGSIHARNLPTSWAGSFSKARPRG
ncbi:participates in chromosomal partition during cell division [Arthrobacter sp. Hiyo8]|nr:participates in chromosomal partition during cell division [Arthrobacter sp. Hiyo8]